MPVVVWAQAEDGAWAQLRLHDVDDDLVRGVWPPRGLRKGLAPRAVQGTAEVIEGGADDLPALESALGLFAVAHLLTEVAVHAALLAFEGRQILLPGPSLHGKSTLAAAAARCGEGWEVRSDEFALVDPQTGLVRGWPRKVRLREGQGWAHHDLVIPGPAARVVVVADLRYAPGETESITLDVISPAAAAMAILANTVCAQLRPQDSLAAARLLVRDALVVSGVRAEAVEALAPLAQVLQGRVRYEGGLQASARGGQ